MLATPLSRFMDLRKLVSQRGRVSGRVPLIGLERLKGLIADSHEAVEIRLEGTVDEENRPLLRGRLTACLELVCQRCLEPVTEYINREVMLGLVWSDDESSALPAEVDPLVIGTGRYDLYELVSEELILTIPTVPRHSDLDCRPIGFNGQPCAEQQHPNPFRVLAGLKSTK